LEDCGQTINPGGVQGWFDEPVFARLVSNADRIGADDVLTGIDALMNGGLAVVLADMQAAGWGAPGSGLRVMIHWSASTVC